MAIRQLDATQFVSQGSDDGDKGGFVGDKVLKFVQAARIVGPWNPELEIASATIFFFEMIYCTLEVLFRAEIRIMLLTELESTTDNCLCINDPISFSDNHTIYGSRG